MKRKVETKVTAVKSVQMYNTSKVRCSTTNEELDALFTAVDMEISDDPEAAMDLLDVLDDNPGASEEMQEELEVIRSNI